MPARSNPEEVLVGAAAVRAALSVSIEIATTRTRAVEGRRGSVRFIFNSFRERWRGARAARPRSLHEPRAFGSTGHPRARLALLVLAWGCTPLAVAWGPQGHRTVGAIADRLLSARTHAVVLQLLAGDLDKFDRPSGRTTLEAVSVWS